VLQSRYAVNDGVQIEGHWTIQLVNHGNFEGEPSNRPAIPSFIGDYPEIYVPERNFPEGRLPGFQRHRVRLYGTYDLDLDRAGDLLVGLLWSYDSGRPYSLVAGGQPFTAEQLARDPGYASLPPNQDVYFGERGSRSFRGASLLDLSVTYRIPVWSSLQPRLKLYVYNLLNSRKQISWDTTVVPDRDGPVDADGLPTRYIEAPSFGQARGNGDYVPPTEVAFALGFTF